MLRGSSECAGLAVANAADPGGNNPGIRERPIVAACQRSGLAQKGEATLGKGRLLPCSGDGRLLVRRPPSVVVPTSVWQLPAGRLGLTRETTQRALFTRPARASSRAAAWHGDARLETWVLLRREG
jgi:hypothetical protein